jgi:3-oxoacyl-[acyl-carrier protein] reductase
MKIEFVNQRVLITGATRGMGKCMAEDFAALGADLILTGTRKEEIDTLNRSAQQNGLKRRYCCVDFTDRKSTEDFLELLGEYERIDVCVNNAGINRINPIDETKIEDLEAVTDVNLRAPFLIIRQVSRVMKANRYGRIINISSIFGVISKEKRAVYSTTKFGINGLTAAASSDLARYNVLVNSVSPGFVLTELTRRILSEEEMETLATQVPLRRFASPEEISKVVLFLCSKFNTYLTGQNIVVDGGFVSV